MMTGNYLVKGGTTIEVVAIRQGLEDIEVKVSYPDYDTELREWYPVKYLLRLGWKYKEG